jgi:hypothetical protein
LCSYFFIFFYLAFSWLRRPIFLELLLNYVYATVVFLKRSRANNNLRVNV